MSFWTLLMALRHALHETFMIFKLKIQIISFGTRKISIYSVGLMPHSLLLLCFQLCMFLINTSRQVWQSSALRFSSKSRSRIAHLKRKLQSLRRDSKSYREFLSLAKELADQLAAMGKSVDDEDLISYISSGLKPSYTSLVTAFNFATRNISNTRTKTSQLHI